MKTVAFIIPPTVELLDLAGPVQVFTEARFYGFDINIEFYLYDNDPVSTSGLRFGKIDKFTRAQLREGDFLFVPGMDQEYVRSASFVNQKAFFEWLKKCSEQKVNVCSVCNGAFALGYAGLLNGLECTTHWRRTEELQMRFPETKVIDNLLYVKNSLVYTSGGIASGIDLALAILEDLAGAAFAQKVARGLVIYYRSNGTQKPGTVSIDFRNHLNVDIHEVQNYIVDSLSGDTSISRLASLVDMSARNLTRLFKQTTGITVNDYLTWVRVETARALLKDSRNSLTYVAAQCGFKTARQLQRILK